MIPASAPRRACKEIDPAVPAVAVHFFAKTIEEIAKGATDQAKENEQGVGSITELGSYIEDTQTIRNNLNNSIENVDIFKNDGIRVLEHLVEKTIENSEASKRINSVVLRPMRVQKK